MIIGIDFDGTIVEHCYPNIGYPVPGAVDTIKLLIDAGHRIILWTMRSGDTLLDAVNWCKANNIHLWGINVNPHQDWSTSPKAYCQLYIDDAAVGCPLTKVEGGRPYVDWMAIRNLLTERGAL